MTCQNCEGCSCLTDIKEDLAEARKLLRETSGVMMSLLINHGQDASIESTENVERLFTQAWKDLTPVTPYR